MIDAQLIKPPSWIDYRKIYSGDLTALSYLSPILLVALCSQKILTVLSIVGVINQSVPLYVQADQADECVGDMSDRGW